MNKKEIQVKEIRMYEAILARSSSIRSMKMAWDVLEKFQRGEITDIELVREAVDWATYRRGLYDGAMFSCLHCGEEERDAFMLKDEIWAEACPELRGTLHLSCVEQRLGRKLVVDDFKPDCTWNNGIIHFLGRDEK